MRPNRLRQLMGETCRVTLGTALHTTWPGIAEVVGHTGLFDYVEFQAEYAPFGLRALESFCQASRLHGLGSLIKVDLEPTRFLAQRSIRAGFEGLLFTDCRSADDARLCVSAAGSAALVVLMIEKREAVECLEDILSVPGIDMIQWGAGDYAMSMGRADERSFDWVWQEEKRATLLAQEKGIRVRGWLPSLEHAERYLSLGVRDFCLGTDIMIIHDWLCQQGQTLRRVLGGAES